MRISLAAAIRGCVLALLVGLVAGCGSPAGQTGTGFVAGDGSVTFLDPTQRTAAPAIDGRTLQGESWSLADQRGKVVVLNVWASWCAPCRAEAPELVQAATEYVGQPVQFVGLNTRDSATTAQAFITRFDIPYPNVADSDGRLQLAFADTLPPQAIPSTVIIDQQGRVAARALGKVTAATLDGLISALLDEDPQQ
ncbi:MAG: TlpA family protein disulfide reductase [Actinomycetales bacterium]